MVEREIEYSCCEEMHYHITNGEIGLIYVDKCREYGLEYRDGGTSYQIIRFCPWCGSKLPLSLSDE
jgi:hypothetical protein